MKKSVNNSVSRKEFMKTAGSVALFSALGIPFITSCSDSTSAMDDNGGDSVTNIVSGNEEGITIAGNSVIIDVSSNAGAALRSTGGWLLITGAQVLAVNIGGGTIRAFTSVCTHQGCDTSWGFSNNLFTCSCHGSQFDTGGGVVRGPASRDLEEFIVDREDDEVTITK